MPDGVRGGTYISAMSSSFRADYQHHLGILDHSLDTSSWLEIIMVSPQRQSPDCLSYYIRRKFHRPGGHSSEASLSRSERAR